MTPCPRTAALRAERQDQRQNRVGTLGHEIKKTQLVPVTPPSTASSMLWEWTLSTTIFSYFPSVRVYHRLSTRETRVESMKTPTMTVCNVEKGKVKKKGCGSFVKAYG